jgi:hypothetical protein
MKAYNNGPSFTVSYNESDSHKFSSQWPCSNVKGAGSFSFDNGGDVIDCSGSAMDSDGPDWVAFLCDCKTYGTQKMKKLRGTKPRL